MSLSIFLASAGVSQGRIEPSGWTAPDGSFVLGLGSDVAGVFEFFDTGDGVEWSQNQDLTSARYLRLRARVRAPTVTPTGTEWRAIFKLDGTTVLTIPITSTRDLSDVVLDTGPLGAGAHVVGVRLELAAIGAAVGDVECELPAFYVDSFVLDLTGSHPQLANRSPEPDETRVGVNTSIVLDIQDYDGAGGIDLSKTKVYVEDVLAFDAGTFQTGFDGPDSAQDGAIDGGSSLRLVVDPTSPFASLQLVHVRVVSATLGGATLDETYSFTIADTTSPLVSAAMGISTQRVRVSFSEAIAMDDVALDPANYVFERQSVPAVDIVAVGVEAFSEGAVDVLLNWDSTPSATYQVTVSNVTDLSGNPVTAPTNFAVFFGFQPPVPANRRFDLYRMMPEKNRRDDLAGSGDLKRFLSCLQEVTDLMLYDVDRWTEIIDPDKAPEPFVDAMLVGLGNPFPFTLSLVDKRRLIRVLVQIYRLKGTAVGIINVVRFFLGIEITIVNFIGDEAWILGDDELGVDTILGTSSSYALYSFEIHSIITLTDEQRSRITDIANYMKAAHEHLVRIVDSVPPDPEEIDHLELGLSELGIDWQLH